MQLLAERGDVALPHGQKVVSILLFEDLLIVPLLALVAFMAPPVAGEVVASAGASNPATNHWFCNVVWEED